MFHSVAICEKSPSKRRRIESNLWCQCKYISFWYSVVFFYTIRATCKIVQPQEKLGSRDTVKWQNQQNGMCTQRRLRSVLASAQSDQSSMCTQWVAKDPSFLHADSEDFDQTGQMPRVIWVFAGHTDHFLGFCHEAAQILKFRTSERFAEITLNFNKLTLPWSIASKRYWQSSKPVNPDQTAPDLDLHCLLRSACLTTCEYTVSLIIITWTQPSFGQTMQKTCLMPYANNKSADQPAHPRSLISTFVRCLGRMICILAISKVSRF